MAQLVVNGFSNFFEYLLLGLTLYGRKLAHDMNKRRADAVVESFSRRSTLTKLACLTFARESCTIRLRQLAGSLVSVSGRAFAMVSIRVF